MANKGDKSELLNSMEMPEKHKSGNSGSDLYFEDGMRKIDYILAYEIAVGEDDNEAEQKKIIRETYLKNLQAEGLQIEDGQCGGKKGNDEYGTFKEKKEGESDLQFVKVHAPFDVLCDIAEDMKMKMPISENDVEIKAWYQNSSVYEFFQRIDPFTIRNRHTRDEKSYFVKTFDKDQLTHFVHGDKPDRFFSEVERSRLVYYIIEKTLFGPNDLDLGVDHLKHLGIILDAYPLHSGPVRESSDDTPTNDRQYLQADWACLGRIFKYQPIPAIKSYFGEKVALYFSWLGFYTMFLIPASIVGIICFVYGVVSAFSYVPSKEICDPKNMTDGTNRFYMCPLCDRLCSYYLLQKEGCMYSKITHFFDNEATLFFALVMSVWATIFLEFWKRKQVTLAYEWHTMDFEEDEERPRPEYQASNTKWRKNPVTFKQEPYMPSSQKYARLFGAFGVVVFFIVLVLAAVTGVIVFRAAFYIILISQEDKTIVARSKLIVSACAACINLITINLLKFVYQRISVKLTDWENPRTATDYEDSFTVKMFWFQFVNTYASIFYVAFFKSEFFTGTPGRYKRFTAKKFRFDGCSVQGCFLELTVQLVIIMVGQQIIGNIMEILIPFLKNKYRDWKGRKQTTYTSNNEPQWVTDFEGEMQTKFSLFGQYLEIVLQYGFVTMFVAAFPLAPFVALLNNIVEIRLDAVNFVHNFRRPPAQRAEDIGAWYNILATLTMFSTVVNAFVLAFTSELIPRLVWIYYASPDGSMYGFVDWSMSSFPVADFSNSSKPDDPMKNGIPEQKYCRYPGFHIDTRPYSYSKDYWVVLSARLAFVIAFQAAVLSIKTMIAYVIPDIPKSLELKIKRENYLAAEHDRRHKENIGKRKAKKGANEKEETSAPFDEQPHLSPEV